MGVLRNYLSVLFKKHTPMFANLDLTMRCNSRCAYCYRWAQDYKLGTYDKKSARELTTEQVCRVIDNVAKFPIINLTIQGAEALLRQDLPQILAHAKQKLRTNIITNGILLERMAEKIAPYLSWILISYDTSNKEDYAKLRGVNVLPLVERGIKKIIGLAKKYNFLVITNTVLTKLSYKNLRETISYAFEKLGVHGMSFEEMAYIEDARLPLAKELKLDEAELQDCANILRESKKKYPIMNSHYYLNYLAKKHPYKCKPYNFLTVNAEGKAERPCPLYANDTIDFTESGAHEAWYKNTDKVYNINCNACTMQCVLEVSKLFPVPHLGILADWAYNIGAANARLNAQIVGA